MNLTILFCLISSVCLAPYSSSSSALVFFQSHFNRILALRFVLFLLLLLILPYLHKHPLWHCHVGSHKRLPFGPLFFFKFLSCTPMGQLPKRLQPVPSCPCPRARDQLRWQRRHSTRRPEQSSRTMSEPCMMFANGSVSTVATCRLGTMMMPRVYISASQKFAQRLT